MDSIRQDILSQSQVSAQDLMDWVMANRDELDAAMAALTSIQSTIEPEDKQGLALVRAAMRTILCESQRLLTGDAREEGGASHGKEF